MDDTFLFIFWNIICLFVSITNKYKKAKTILDKTSIDKIDDSIKYIYKIEKKLVNSIYNQENSKRFIIAMKQKLQA